MGRGSPPRWSRGTRPSTPKGSLIPSRRGRTARWWVGFTGSRLARPSSANPCTPRCRTRPRWRSRHCWRIWSAGASTWWIARAGPSTWSALAPRNGRAAGFWRCSSGPSACRPSRVRGPWRPARRKQKRRSVLCDEGDAGLGLPLLLANDHRDVLLVVLADAAQHAGALTVRLGDVLRDLEAARLELRLVELDELVDRIVGGEGKRRGPAFRVRRIHGALDRASRVDRDPLGEVLRSLATPGDLLAVGAGHLDAAGFPRLRGIHHGLSLFGLERDLAVLDVRGVHGHDLARLFVLDGHRPLLRIGGDELEVRVRPHDELRGGHGGVVLILVHLPLDEPAADHEGENGHQGDGSTTDGDPAERPHALLGGRYGRARRRRGRGDSHTGTPFRECFAENRLSAEKIPSASPQAKQARRTYGTGGDISRF